MFYYKINKPFLFLTETIENQCNDNKDQSDP